MLRGRRKRKSRLGEPAFFRDAEAYFFSSGFDSLTEEGVCTEGVGDAAPPAALEDAAPVAPASAFGASPGMGDGVGVAVGAGALGAGAGGGVTTFVSSFLQAVRPTATRAAMRSERVMLFSFRRRINVERGNALGLRVRRGK